MRKLFVLLKKEIKELFTIQAFIPIIVMAVAFMLLGSFISDMMNEEGTGDGGKIYVLDLDNSNLSNEALEVLTNSGFKITKSNQGEISDVIEDAKAINAEAVLVIAKGFSDSIAEDKIQNIDAYSMLTSLSITAQSGDVILKNAVDIINSYISNKIIAENVGVDSSPEFIKNPVIQNDFVVVNGKIANVNSMSIKSFIMSQTIFLPLVIFMIIIFASQMLINTVATEKENKTMETLLSTPISRTSIIGAKMLAAGISALVYAVVYMIGFQNYMGAVTGEEGSAEGLKTAIEQLGLTMGAGDYVLLGISLFASILVALALSSILGVMAEDVKKAQTYLMPIMMLTMIPYLLTMIIDVNTAPLLMKIIIYAIPFSHPFTAASHLFLKDYVPVILGILYQLAVFGIILFVATKIYSSDKIFMTRHSSPKRKLNIKRRTF